MFGKKITSTISVTFTDNSFNHNAVQNKKMSTPTF